MHIHLLSNAPFASTGYGTQSRVLLQQWKRLGHTTSMTCFYGVEGGVLNWQGTPLYPQGHDRFSMDITAAHANHARADVIVSLMDAWVCDPRRLQSGGLPWVPYFPIDSAPLPPPVEACVRPAYDRIVFSHFGEQMMQQAGLACHYVPHAVDTAVFSPADKLQARERLKWPLDKFIVLMVAANKGTPSRKAFPQQLAAFAQFHRQHSDTVLFLHTNDGVGDGMHGVDLRDYIESLGVQRAVRLCDQYLNQIGYGDPYMADLYRAADVLLSVSMGEGFGIPILEAQACGLPVIVGGWTAMPELCWGGWTVGQNDAQPFYTGLKAYQWLPHVGAIAEQLEAAYSHPDDVALREAARQGALAYDADTVGDHYWGPVLERIAQRIQEGS